MELCNQFSSRNRNEKKDGQYCSPGEIKWLLRSGGKSVCDPDNNDVQRLGEQNVDLILLLIDNSINSHDRTTAKQNTELIYSSRTRDKASFTQVITQQQDVAEAHTSVPDFMRDGERI